MRVVLVPWLQDEFCTALKRVIVQKKKPSSLECDFARSFVLSRLLVSLHRLDTRAAS